MSDDEEDTSKEEVVQPAVYEHCCRVYAEMEGQATEMPEGRVYEGYTTRLFQALELSPPYYTRIRDLLIKMGCVEQLRCGGGNAKSRWRLVREPDETIFTLANEMHVRKNGRVTQVEDSLNTMNMRLLRVEQALGLVGSP